MAKREIRWNIAQIMRKANQRGDVETLQWGWRKLQETKRLHTGRLITPRRAVEYGTV